MAKRGKQRKLAGIDRDQRDMKNKIKKIFDLVHPRNPCQFFFVFHQIQVEICSK